MAERGDASGIGGGGNPSEPQHDSEVDDTGGISLIDFCVQLDDCAPTIPDALTLHYLQKAGFSTHDPRIVRLISLAAQKFISDIANDALQYCKMRGSAQSSRKSGRGDRRFTLTMEDLAAALSECGINLKKPSFYN